MIGGIEKIYEKRSEVGNKSIIEHIKSAICCIVWPIFLWSVSHTDESYWQSIYEQEQKLKGEGDDYIKGCRNVRRYDIGN